MSGCNECKFKKSTLNWNDDGTLGKSTYSCENGKTLEAIEWWKNNGKKIDVPLDDMVCYKPTETRTFLDSMGEKLDEMLTLLKK